MDALKKRSQVTEDSGKSKKKVAFLSPSEASESEGTPSESFDSDKIPSDSESEEIIKPIKRMKNIVDKNKYKPKKTNK